MRRFLAVGECMVEFAPAGDGRYAMGFAGDTFNTAWYVRRLADPGIDVQYLSAIGSDAISARMESFMRDAGIHPRLAVCRDRTVGLYLISVANGERSFSYWRQDSAARQLHRQFDRLPDLEPGDVAFFSGITLAILPGEGRQWLLDQMAALRDRGVRVAFDPNLRPRLWPGAEEMRRWITAAAQVSEIALPSFDDESAAFGDPAPQATAERYAAAGAAMVAVKNAAEPAILRSGGTLTEIPPEPVGEVVDTTAAGDSFNAAFLVALAAGRDPRDAVRAGCRLSARVIGHRGALVEPGTG